MARPTDDLDPLLEDFGDIFGDVLGGSAASSRDLRLDLQLTLADVEGVQREVEVPRTIFCADCAGRGAPADAPSTPCLECDASGYRTEVRGTLGLRTLCEACQGRGEIFEVACAVCGGAGGAKRLEKLNVSVPPGVANGQVLRLQGKGNQTAEGPGDLYIGIGVAPHERLMRHGDDLVTRVEISRELAESGGTTVAPLPDGDVEVEVPPNSETGTEVRLAGYGTPRLGSAPSSPPGGGEARGPTADPAARGDLAVRLVLEGEEDPLGVLGLTGKASLDEIKQAYRQRALQLHPDRHPGDANAARRFDELEAAFAALTGATRSANSKAGRPGLLWGTLVVLGAIAALYALLR